jgi:NADPH:quinone reductase-like Zn-dependent oxidoreductase
MQAIVYRTYGPPHALRLEETEKPAPSDGQVLIRVRAASVNPYDWHFMRGEPYPLRLMTGLLKPRLTRLGADAAGEVEAVGTGVTQFKTGDAVFGLCKGAFAEYACASATVMALKPASVTFEQAASVPIAGLTALQALRDKGRLQPGQSLLINGAGGGVGTFAVQIAKAFGAEVTGVCSARNVELVRSLGADRVIDYTREDATSSGGRYDLFFDCVGNHALKARLRVLKPRGIYVGIGAPVGKWGMQVFTGLVKTLAIAPFIGQKILGMVAKSNPGDLAFLGKMIASGKISPPIERRYTLAQTPEAIRYIETGHARGKVVINFDYSNS